jgi:hypothetical protein
MQTPDLSDAKIVTCFETKTTRDNLKEHKIETQKKIPAEAAQTSAQRGLEWSILKAMAGGS